MASGCRQRKAHALPIKIWWGSGWWNRERETVGLRQAKKKACFDSTFLFTRAKSSNANICPASFSCEQDSSIFFYPITQWSQEAHRPACIIEFPAMAYLLPVCFQTPVEFLSKCNESKGEKFPMWAKAPGLWSITSSHVCSSNCCVWASLNPALPLLSPDLIYTLIPAFFPTGSLSRLFRLPSLSLSLWEECMPKVVTWR